LGSVLKLNIVGSRLACLIISMVSVAAFMSCAVAQDVANPVPRAASDQQPATVTGVRLSDDGTRVIYEPEFFSAFGAVTAVDILKRIPGIQDLLTFDNEFVPGGSFQEVEKRGFGSSGEQILINGERLSGKTNDTGAALQRIQAAQVARVEVIRGAVAGLDVRSQGLVVNVVLKAATGTGSWEANATHYTGNLIKWGGRASYAAAIDRLSYNVSIQDAPRFLIRDRTETYFALTGTPSNRQTELNKNLTDERTLTASANYRFANGDKFALNGSYEDEHNLEKQPSYQFALNNGALTFLRLDNRERDTDETTWEVGGDYTHDVVGGGQFKGLFVYTKGTFDRLSPFKLTPAGEREILTQLQNEARSESEKIVRGSYKWGWSEAVDAEAGAEVAINTLNKTVNVSSIFRTGTLSPVELFNAQSKIRETRFEPFSSLSWQATQSIFVDGRLEVEYSRLNQSGRDVNNRRSLFYIRPGLDLRYDVAPLNQVRGSINRTVSQLDFTDFVATFETDDSRPDVVNAGNPDLVPEKAWEYALTYERRLGRDGGVVTLKAFYNQISDHIDNIAVGPLKDTSAVGNVGPGRAYGLETKASVRLGSVGLPGVVVNATGLVRKSRFTDSFTGRTSDFQDYPGYAYSFGFRHDTGWRDLSYGASFDDEDTRYASDIGFVQTLNRRLDGTAFVEMRALPGVKAKLEVRRILRGGAERKRSTFTGNRGFSPLRRTEQRIAIFDRAIALTLSGNF
jgi:outer membrane receptor for ferrienterochelin and colicins